MPGRNPGAGAGSSRQRFVYQLKVTLKGIRPPIWRRFQVTDDISLYQLHLVLQEVMGWRNCHLYLFTIGDWYYTDPTPHPGPEDRDARRYRLWQVFEHKEGAKVLYEYDFGDSWKHELRLERVLPEHEGIHYPVCLAGARACPPEDCGGVPGYFSLLEVMRNPQHKRHGEAMEWLGRPFDPEAFSLETVNLRLKRLRSPA